MSRSQTRPPAVDAACNAIDRVTRSVFDAAEELCGAPEAEPALVIALCATVLDRLLEVLLEMDPEQGRRLHATVLRGLATPGRLKLRVQ